MHPASPYGAAKLYAHWITKNYRVSYNIFACSGILFNHEGPYRGDTFVTKKIVNGAVNIFRGSQKYLYLGNLDAKRDWGDAEDYVYGMWKIMQQKNPDDFVLATGKSYSVRTFTKKVFNKLGFDLAWKGKNISEIGYDKKTKRTLIKIDRKYFRPQEVDFLRGDYQKAFKKLKWKPKTTIDQLVNKMINFSLTNTKI